MSTFDRVVKNPSFGSQAEFHASLRAKGVGAKDYPNSHTEIEYLGGNKFAASISVGHKVFFDEADNGNAKKHKLTDNRPDYVVIQSAQVCVEIRPFYATYYDVQHQEVRLEEERWIVQRLFKAPDEWRDVDRYNPTITVEEYDESTGHFVSVSVVYDTDYGVLVVEYLQREGSALKHNVYFQNTSGSTQTFRVIQKWTGIVGTKVNDEVAPVVTDEPYLTFHDANKPAKEFNISENLWAMVFNPDGTEKTEEFLQLPITIETSAGGLKADFIYGNWALANDESLEIDPDTATLNNPTIDLHAYLYLGDYSREETVYVSFYRSGSQIYFRGCVEWNISSLAGSTITRVDFRYEGLTNAGGTADIREMSSQPSAQPNNDAGNKIIYDDTADGTAYLLGSATFPQIGENKSVGTGGGIAWDTAPNADLQTAVTASRSWFALGFKSSEITADHYKQFSSEEESGVNPPPTLYVEYTPPPEEYEKTITEVVGVVATPLLATTLPKLLDVLAIADVQSNASSLLKLDTPSLVEIFSKKTVVKRVFVATLAILDTFVSKNRLAITNALSVTDTILRKSAKAVLDITSLVEDFAKTLTAAVVQKVFTDVLFVADALSRRLQIKRAVSATMNLISVRVLAIERDFIDAVSTTGVIKKAASTTLSNILSVVDVLSRRGIYARISSDVVSILDTSVSRCWVKISNALSVADTITRKATKAISNALNLVEDFTKSLASVFTEVFSIVDAKVVGMRTVIANSLTVVATFRRNVVKTLFTALDISEVFARKTEVKRVLADVVSVLDIPIGTTALAVTSVIAVVDAFVRKVVFKRFISASLSIFDASFTRTKALLVNTVSLVDIVLRGTKRFFANSVEVLDISVTRNTIIVLESIVVIAVAATLKVRKYFTSVVEVVDTSYKRAKLSASDAVSLVDETFRKGAKTLVDFVSASETFSRAVRLFRIDALSILDTPISKSNIFLSNIVTLVETFVRIPTYTEFFTEVIQLADSIFKFIPTGLEKTLTFVRPSHIVDFIRSVYKAIFTREN